MLYNYTQEDLFSSQQKTGVAAPELKNTFANIRTNFGIKNKISQEVKNSKSFGKFCLVCAVVLTALFSFTSFAYPDPLIRQVQAEITTVKTDSPLDLSNEDGKGVEVTPQIIAELKAKSVKTMTPAQKKEALKILLNEADENTILEALK